MQKRFVRIARKQEECISGEKAEGQRTADDDTISGANQLGAGNWKVNYNLKYNNSLAILINSYEFLGELDL